MTTKYCRLTFNLYPSIWKINQIINQKGRKKFSAMAVSRAKTGFNTPTKSAADFAGIQLVGDSNPILVVSTYEAKKM